jgi:radical SAM superfamily enzyme YgiQ (UPF0313 family)
VIGGEFELPLVRLADSLSEKVAPTVPGVATRDWRGGVFLGRLAFRVPRRDVLPPLERYARVVVGAEQRLVGYVEASRGCAHHCLHCPIPPVYGGRLRIVPEEIVLEDVCQLVAMGAEHVTFGDPDFFNGVRHSLRIVEAMHEAFPRLTFDATIKIEHILEHRREIPRLAAAGCLFIVSAVEAVQDQVLAHLEKGHTAADVRTALAVVDAVGLPLRPTFVPFTPWAALEDYIELLGFIHSHALVDHVDPIQLAIRLLVPCSSALLDTDALTPYLEGFDADHFSYRWRHPDPRVENLHRRVTEAVQQGARDGAEARVVFDRIYSLAAGALGGPVSPPTVPDRRRVGPVPRLTEPWFC